MEFDEKELIHSFLKGDENAFNIIARNYQKKIYWHALRMLGNHDEADELTQEVLIVIYKKINTFRFNSSLSTWIYRITATRALNVLKKRKVKKFFGIDKEHENQLVSGTNIVKNYEDKESVQKVIDILQKLPSRQREVFILRNFENMSYEEIREITGRTAGALKSSYFHALKKVMEYINE